MSFEKELRVLLNTYSIDNECNIPDYILADLICENISSLSSTMKALDGHNFANGLVN